jgi:hypothetical protein
MWHKAIFLMLASAIALSAVEKLPSYKGSMRIPVDLYTTDGVRLKKGHYELEVKGQEPHRVLVFSLGDKVSAEVAELTQEDPLPQTPEIPVVGTHLLRSTAVPLATAKERQFSQTGKPRYQEEKHDWKGTMRVYQSRQERVVFFIFQERQRPGEWRSSHFRLLLSPKQ